MITVVGIPVYYHYCGGELEEINYVLKSSGCCGGEEDDSSESDNGCCKDENLVLKSNVDFTLKGFNDYTFVKTFSEVCYISLPFSMSVHELKSLVSDVYAEFPPPKLQQDLVISTSVLRI